MTTPKTPTNIDTLTPRERHYIADVRISIANGAADAVRWKTAAFTGYRATLREMLWREAIDTWTARAEGGAA